MGRGLDDVLACAEISPMLRHGSAVVLKSCSSSGPKYA